MKKKLEGGSMHDGARRYFVFAVGIEQRFHIRRVEQIALLAELAVDFDLAIGL
jgi:hypothetical protein